MAMKRSANGKIDGRTLRSQASRAALLEAGRQLFLDCGYRAVTVSQIAKQAGVAHGSFYNHFRGKDDLLLCILEELTAVLHDIVEGPPNPPGYRENRALLYDQILRFLELSADWKRMLQVYREAMDVSEKVKHHWEQAMQRVTKRAEADIVHYQRRGIARSSLDPALAAVALIRMVEHFHWQLVAGVYEPGDAPRIARLCTDLYTEGMYPAGGG